MICSMCLGEEHAQSALKKADCPLCECFKIEEAPLLPGSLLKRSETGICGSGPVFAEDGFDYGDRD